MSVYTPAFERIYVAAGTGGTLAGLLCGFQLAGREASIRGICVAHQAQEDQPAVIALAGEVCKLLGQPELPNDVVELTDAFLGEAYGVPTQEGLEAISLCARNEGLLLDPVYTSKAMAALVSDVRNGIAGDGPVLFWHTGGAPALFAYRSELSQTDRA
ncbi:MAG: pyridoxal-phosphate dependent enzyme [bacterium]|nr:pyridoxal-phosphate dependent enzyme [bacterium]